MKSIALLVASLVLFSTTELYPNWQIEDFFAVTETEEINPDENESFGTLKAHVKQYLLGSWCSEDKINLLMDLTYLTHPKVCVEIGAFTGSSVLPVAATLDYLGEGKIYAIDPWSNEEAVRNLSLNDPNRSWWNSLDMSVVRHYFDNMLATWALNSVCIPIAKTSSLAFDEIPDIDFLHIDGNFSEQGSLYDTKQYLSRLKPGGYVLLSNVYHTVNNQQPKLKSFALLFETCEFISEVDRDNAVLFRKL